MKKPVTLSLREIIIASAKAEAKKKKMSLSDYVTEALVAYWSDDQSPSPAPEKVRADVEACADYA